MKSLLLTLITSLTLAASTANAGSLGLEGNFFNTAHTLSNEKNSQVLYGDAFLTLPFYEKSKLHFVFNYTLLSESYKSTDTTTVGIAHFGPMAGLRQQFWEVFYFTVLGSPYFQANYKVTNAPREQWSGFAYQARLSLEGELSRGIGLMVSINYFAASYTQKPAGAASTQNTFNRNAIVPAAGLLFRF